MLNGPHFDAISSLKRIKAINERANAPTFINCLPPRTHQHSPLKWTKTTPRKRGKPSNSLHRRSGTRPSNFSLPLPHIAPIYSRPPLAGRIPIRIASHTYTSRFPGSPDGDPAHDPVSISFQFLNPGKFRSSCLGQGQRRSERGAGIEVGGGLGEWREEGVVRVGVFPPLYGSVLARAHGGRFARASSVIVLRPTGSLTVGVG